MLYVPFARMPPSAPSYFSLSRTPRYSLTFALPLLLLYEVAAAAISDSNGGIRNGADVMLKTLFATVAGPRGPLIFEVLLVATMIGLAIRDVRRNPGGLRASIFVRMFGEAAVLAALFGVVVGTITTKLIHAVQPLAIGQLQQVGTPTALTVSLGAGLYEELLFRVLLVGVLMTLAKRVLGFGPRVATIAAVVVSALLFSTFHYIGTLGDTFTVTSFVFRAIAGLAFSGLYVTRGFGITAWTHALYDVFLTVSQG